MSERAREDEEDHGILDSVRRILAQSHVEDDRSAPEDGSILDLDPAMMVGPPKREMPSPAPAQAPAFAPEPVREAPPEMLVGDDTARAARHALGSLRAASREQSAARIHRGGPTIEEIVREEIRPMLRDWLDTHLPPLVETLVRAEIAKISGADT